MLNSEQHEKGMLSGEKKQARFSIAFAAWISVTCAGLILLLLGLSGSFTALTCHDVNVILPNGNSVYRDGSCSNAGNNLAIFFGVALTLIGTAGSAIRRK